MAGVMLDKVDLNATHNLLHILIYRMQLSILIECCTRLHGQSMT